MALQEGPDRQAKLVRPLAPGLLDGEAKEWAQKRLVQAVEHYDYCVGTGFLSTPFLLPVLTEAGEAETAYKMLENTKKPGWLAEVLEGAATIWENWEGNLSQNHYSPGAVCQWLFDTVAGIRADRENHLIIAPVPGGSLKYAQAEYLSPYGRVMSRWEKKDGEIAYTVEIPANVTAEILLPDGTRETAGPGVHTYSEAGASQGRGIAPDMSGGIGRTDKGIRSPGWSTGARSGERELKTGGKYGIYKY